MQLEEFRNEPFTDFSDPQNKAAFEAAMKKVEGQLGRTWGAWIGGQQIVDFPGLESRDPGNLDRLIGTCQDLGGADGERAVEAAYAAFPEWSRRPVEERCQYFLDAARLMRERKHEFSAAMVFESGKSWAEADADTAEAIDFLEYYVRHALELAKPQPVVPIAGEKNEMRYIPLGVGAIIPPWNFPLAIMAGMTCAALVVGNTAVLKPAEQTPCIAARFVGLMHEVGLPRDVLQFITGDGEVVGGAITRHAKTRFISFTGSRAVGLLLHQVSATVAPGQIWMKRLVAEMGGKDGMLIDNDCDLDSAVDGVVAAAFGFQGQKCSACSRAMIHQDVYDEFIEKLVPKVKAITQGHQTDLANYMGPVIDDEARDKILSYVEIGKSEGRLLVGGEKAEGNGYYVQPTVFADIAPDARLALDEIFGPVLALIKVDSWEHGMEVANNTEYGLTGAIYTNDVQKQEDAKRDFHVGNFYINRKCTGALVGVHPFGGFNMSGTDSKAGGPDYLLHFVQAKSISTKV